MIRYLCLTCGTVLSAERKLGRGSCECGNSVDGGYVGRGKLNVASGDYATVMRLIPTELVKKKSVGITQALQPLIVRLHRMSLGKPVTPDQALLMGKEYVAGLERFIDVFGLDDTVVIPARITDVEMEITDVGTDSGLGGQEPEPTEPTEPGVVESVVP